MSASLLLGVDVGSSGVKSILLDVERGIIANFNSPVNQFSDHPGWSEADTDEWWNGFTSAIPQLLKDSGASSTDIKAVSFAGMVPALVPIDHEGNPVRRAMLQNDARATVEIEEIKSKLTGLDLLATTGSVISQQWIAPTISWLAKNESNNLNRTKAIVGSYDWMAHRLGADLHVELNWAIESGLFKLDGSIFDEVIRSVTLNWPEIPKIKRSGERVGEVSAKAAGETGLVAGTSIIVGGADHVLSAYGAGLSKQGDGLIKLGGAGDILAVSDKLVIDSRLYLDAHPVPNKWLPNGCMATSGSILRWEQSLFGGESLENLDLEASNENAGNLLLLPYFLGEKTPLHDPNLRGAILGFHLGTSRGDIHRAALEAIAYGFRHHFEIFAELGLAITNPKVTNGGSKSRLWREILANVINSEITSIINHPGASFGAAICAGIGTGLIQDWSYVNGALESGEKIAPNAKNREIYDERYAEFIETTRNLTGTLHNIARSQNG